MAQFISNYRFVDSPGNCFSYNIQLSKTFDRFCYNSDFFCYNTQKFYRDSIFFFPKRGPNEAIHFLTTYNLENISDIYANSMTAHSLTNIV
jgi:hypothetical protein